MANDTEVERMVVRLMGDPSSYRAMLQEARSSTRDTAQEIQRTGGTIEQTERTVNSFGTEARQAFDEASTSTETWVDAMGGADDATGDLSGSIGDLIPGLNAARIAKLGLAGAVAEGARRLAVWNDKVEVFKRDAEDMVIRMGFMRTHSDLTSQALGSMADELAGALREISDETLNALGVLTRFGVTTERDLVLKQA